jgi:hypothetical protein
VSGAFEGRAEVIQRRKSLLVGAVLLYGVATVMTYFGAPGWAVFVEQGLALSLLVAFFNDGYRVHRERSVRADTRGLWIDETLVIERRKIETAYLLAVERPVVHFLPGPRSLVASFDVAFEDQDQARGLLDAIGFRAGQTVATFRAFRGSLPSTLVAVALTAVLVTVLAKPLTLRLGAIAGSIGATALLLALVGLLMMRLRTQVDVGSDGVLLRRASGRRFLSYRALSAVSVEGRLLVLSLATGETIRLALLGATSEPARLHDALTQRIEEARTFVGTHESVNAEAWLTPGGRPVAHWLRELRGLARAHDYREAQIDAERLWRVVADPGAPPATRAGAAIALSRTMDGDTRTRLRVAADACADPKLRVALGCVAEGATDAELVEALDGLVEAGPAPARTDR